MPNIQIFTSYARDDDKSPPESPDAKGFVTSLHEQLAVEFRRRGGPPAKIWRDDRQIERAEHFDPVAQQAIIDSSILLVVLSRNWIARPNCRRELMAFVDRWRNAGELRVKDRIVIVAKRYIDPDDRPSWLPGQVEYAFYSLDGPADTGQEHEFFAQGSVQDERYYQRVKELASHLWRIAAQVENLARDRDQNDRDLEIPATSETLPAGSIATAPGRPGVTSSLPRIAISYRRSDSDVTGRIFDRLISKYGKESVFRDIDNIPLGIDFREYIIEAISQTDILIAVVGPKWFKGTGRRGSQGINDETDLVRIEVETALQRKIAVIPALVHGATMPKPTELPDGLKNFAFRNGTIIDSGQDFDHHMNRLIQNIDAILEHNSRRD